MATCPACSNRYPDEVATCSVDGSQLLPDGVLPMPDAELSAGTMVGEYRVDSKLGEGGFGAVYRALHPVIGKAAAIKVLHRPYSVNPQMVSRFIAEARAVNQIRHRNIIDIFGFGKLGDGRQYYVMELLDGMTLERFLRDRGRVGAQQAIPILRGIARALDAAHACGIAHRDLKPDNVFLAFDEEGEPFPKLLDFGIAKLLGDGAPVHKTRTGAPIGTPHYMSPEQCRGKNVDHRTDVYSFGVLTHQMLTGSLPFDGDDAMAVLVQHTSKEPPRASGAYAELPAALDAPIAAMLAKDPQARPASVGEAIEAVAAAAKSAGMIIPGAPVRAAARRSGTEAGSSDAPRTPSAGGMTPAAPAAKVQPAPLTPTDMAALAEATTMMQNDAASPKTLLGSESDVSQRPGPPRRRRVVYATLASLAVAAGAAMWLLRPPTPGVQQEPATAGEASVESAQAMTAAVEPPAPPAVPAATASTEAAPPAASSAPASSARPPPRPRDTPQRPAKSPPPQTTAKPEYEPPSY
jgi:serine/threonine-protein kinase